MKLLLSRTTMWPFIKDNQTVYITQRMNLNFNPKAHKEESASILQFQGSKFMCPSLTCCFQAPTALTSKPDKLKTPDCPNIITCNK